MRNCLVVVFVSLFACAHASAPPPAPLGRFSISLTVKDVQASRAFYEGLGFVAEPDPGKLPNYGTKWLILSHGTAHIGLFQGAFERNMLTFQPADVRAVQRAAKARGIHFQLEAPDGQGPAAALAIDPDGNPVLVDQI